MLHTCTQMPPDIKPLLKQIGWWWMEWLTSPQPPPRLTAATNVYTTQTLPWRCAITYLHWSSSDKLYTIYTRVVYIHVWENDLALNSSRHLKCVLADKELSCTCCHNGSMHSNPYKCKARLSISSFVLLCKSYLSGPAILMKLDF